MKTVQQKVKDIVEVRPYESIRDFTAEPAKTLANYHFTDVTADLMAKWLDGISTVQAQNGAAYALAGYRGVGKSHFMAALGAIAANPELRSRVTESHVAYSAQRLLRRHYPVVYVRRGTRETLIEEFREAVELVFESGNSASRDSFAGILQDAVGTSGELPFLLLIDTAFERGSRVSRDDGPGLSEIAEAAKGSNVFIGVALDDDIAGADGSNSSISKTFTIDYLDQGHLYKVVNSHIFPKHNQMQPVLHEIYNYFSNVLPSFRWSEQKFAALYPLHPVILEVAPFVRLYVHDFALLGFATEAGERILGRPSNSLIALDEVYDSAEIPLRKIEDLKGAFAAYDTLNSEVVAKIPVMQRLQAKLILKALLLLSLDGQGTTANEICASVLIFDESDPPKALKTVDELINTFAKALPEDIRITTEEGRETRYGFKVASKDNLNQALTEAISDASRDSVPKVMRRLINERFPDAAFSLASAEHTKDWMECHISWRGSLRRGRIFWRSESEEAVTASPPPVTDAIDWEIFIDLQHIEKEWGNAASGVSRVVWKPDELRNDETDTILSFYALSTNRDLRETYGEQFQAALHSHALAAEKIFNRSFLEDGKLVIDGFDYNFTDEARSAQFLSEAFTIMLEPLFETRYPEHPKFTQKLGVSEVAMLVSDLFSGSRQNLAEVQLLAQTFALPLGLVKLDGGLFLPETEENLRAHPLASEILKLVETNGSAPVSLKNIYANLRREPNGLVREAQQLILTALVAQRQIDFVTSSGDRINRRSLDLKIIWDDITGIAKPLETTYSIEKLTRWATLFTGSDAFKSIENAKGRESVRASFAQWTADWKTSRILERFAELPDDILNLRIWQLAARISKTFGSVSECIEAASVEQMPLEECLDRIADAFSDSEIELRKCREELAGLDSFINGAALRKEISSYVALCEMTPIPAIEELRSKLSVLMNVSFALPSEANNRELGYLWAKFQRDFSEYFIKQHDNVMRSHDIPETYGLILKSDEWWEFEILSGLSLFSNEYWSEAKILCRQLEELDCGFDTMENLKAQPFCICSYSLSKNTYWQNLPQMLSETISNGLKAYRANLTDARDILVPKLEKFSAESADKGAASAAGSLGAAISKGKDLPPLSDTELKVLVTLLRVSSFALADRTSSMPSSAELSNGKKEAKKSKKDLVEEVVDEALLLNV
ncbi:MAG: hypothetical protein ACR2M8_03780 [Pyrinomonadaceae bacterium]|nr:hypothetical protein [Blastocatellia bacterium]MDQ3491308.1 hypothetical protein [Acidobacteriota bacterium]